jgi:hypothetical protein
MPILPASWLKRQRGTCDSGLLIDIPVLLPLGPPLAIMLISPSYWRNKSVQTHLVTTAYADQAHHNPTPQFNGFHRMQAIGPTATLAQNRIDLEILSLAGRPFIYIRAVRGDHIFQIRGLIAKELYRASDVAVEVALVSPGHHSTLACCVGISELLGQCSHKLPSPPCISLSCILMRCYCGPESKYAGYMPGDCGGPCGPCSDHRPHHLRGGPCDCTKYACWNHPRHDCDHRDWSLGPPLPLTTRGHRHIRQSFRQPYARHDIRAAPPSEEPSDSDIDINH